ncbi:type VII secretion system-associated protein [Saccharopolyspora sp. K220]|uniref:type VII secretion system-associated protein n=1 Tax=Saccharopolyspora soli TaxID=2926618 RepID=UPI001F57786E|nr:type VII secretion system-associated protein [Saccharopolyspora soli]MCI2423079.1 type VII secretion system-associated protein [Saccharopolyspora soli]
MSNTSLPPPITAAMKEQARRQPGRKLFVVDPEFGVDQQVPGWGVRGGFPVTDTGDIDVHGWHPNPAYRPGPRTLGWPTPDTAADRALELVSAGYAPQQTLRNALTTSDAQLHILTDEQGTLIVLGGTRNTCLLACYTSPARIPDGVRTTTLPAPFILQSARERALDAIVLNPDCTPSLVLPTRAPAPESDLMRTP